MSVDEEIDGCSDFSVGVGDDGSGVVRCEADRHPVPRVGPVGVVTVLLGNEGHASHEGEGLREVSKYELAL